ncbi:MAG: hypothetical protein KBF12_00085 [Sebaldella sp.]|nr:hypothetical protein [Sebaldella sp.]
MNEIDKIILSDPRIKDLNKKELTEYEIFTKNDIGYLIEEGVSEPDIILFVKSLIEVFFTIIIDKRRKKIRKI